MSPMRDALWGTYHGSMRVYPSTGGTQTTMAQSAMPQVMGWDAYDGRLGVGYKALSNSRLYVRGADYIVNCSISYNATGQYSQYELTAPQAANLGKSFWQTKDGNLYEVVDTVGDGSGLEYQLVDRNAKQDVVYNEGTEDEYTQNEFVYQSDSGTICNYQRTYITCDHLASAWHYGTFIESPSWSNDNSVYDGTPNPQNTEWRMGNYAGVRVQNCTLTKTDGLVCSFMAYQNASATGTCYTFYAAGTAPSRFNGGVHTDTITTANAAVTDAVTKYVDSNILHEVSSFRLQARPAAVDPNLFSSGQYFFQMDSPNAPGTYAFRIYQYPDTMTSPLGGQTFMYTNTGYKGSGGNWVEGKSLGMHAGKELSLNGFVDGACYGMFFEDNGIDGSDPDNYVPTNLNPQVLMRPQTTSVKGVIYEKYTPTQPLSVTTKEYVDDEISQAIEGSQGDTSIEIGTPTSATEPDDAPGSMKVDENFLWVKTNTAWKKLSLAAFDANVSNVTVQLTQEQFDAIAEPDPNVLYIIVG